jgi:hypothetical protein
MNSLPGRENHSASLEIRSDAVEQPTTRGASVSNASSRLREELVSRAIN